MSDNATPQQLGEALGKNGSVPAKRKGAALPENILLKRRDHLDADHDGSPTLATVHVTTESVAVYEMTPPHAPRVQTPAYVKSRKYLIETQDKPCVVCGVRKSTLGDPTANKFGATELETHHYPIERSLADACDPAKIHLAYPEVIDRETLEAFLDSPRNLIVLCSTHHRSLEQGIHHLLVQDYAVLPYLYDNYQITASAKSKSVIVSQDDAAEKAAGLE